MILWLTKHSSLNYFPGLYFKCQEIIHICLSTQTDRLYIQVNTLKSVKIQVKWRERLIFFKCMTFFHLTLVSSPLFSRRRYSISAWSFSRVSLCCCWRNWIFFCMDATRGSMSLWQDTPTSLPAGGTAGSGFSWFAGKPRGERGFPRRPTRVHCGKCLTGGRL